MVKSELIKHIASKAYDLSREDVESYSNRILDFLRDSAVNGNRIEIRGFGSFSLHHHKSRTAHNPRTCMKVLTEPKSSLHFRPGKELRDRVDESRKQSVSIIPEKRD